MSETAPHRRIRALASALDPQTMGFVLDTPVQGGEAARFASAAEAEAADSPLGRALFAIDGVAGVEAAGGTIWVRKIAAAEWTALKPAIGAEIRRVLGAAECPLGMIAGPGAAPGAGEQDGEIFAAVKLLLADRINPSIAAHGGRIALERVEGRVVYLRMSGGCQGCAASSATLRQGVERTLRQARPDITKIVDLTDHASGDAPFYRHDSGPSPLFSRPLPEGSVTQREGRIEVDPEILAPRLGLSAAALQQGLRDGSVTAVAETGEGAHAGLTRITLRSRQRAWAAEIAPDGRAREVPPPAAAGKAAQGEAALVARIRRYLEARAPDNPLASYGKIARALGLDAPGAVAQVTRALEATMRDDAAAGCPFIAARAVSRARDGLPGKGFFDLAHRLGRGPRATELDRDFHARELARFAQRGDMQPEAQVHQE